MIDTNFFSSRRGGRVANETLQQFIQLARSLKAAGQDIISLSSGEPGFPSPDHIQQATIAAIKSHQTYYTDTDGSPYLKRAIIGKFKRENKLEYKMNEISVGQDVRQVLSNAMLSTINPGDEVILPAPYWIVEKNIIEMAGGAPVIVNAQVQNGFKLTPHHLEKAITDRTKWLFLDSPTIMTGDVYSENDLEALGEVLRRNPHVWIMNNNMYEHFLYDTRATAPTMVQINPDLFHRTLTLNSVALAYNMTGCGVGYAGAPNELIYEMRGIQSSFIGNPSSLDQEAAVAALNGPQDFMTNRVHVFKDRLDLVKLEISKMPGVVCSTPDSAFYLMINCEELIAKTAQAQKPSLSFGPHQSPKTSNHITSAYELATHLLKREGLAVLPGDGFGAPKHLRISLATDQEALFEGCLRMQHAFMQLAYN